MKKAEVEKLVLDLRTIQDEVAKMTSPIDLEALERDGLIEKVGAWYAVPDIQRLPDAAGAKISATKAINGRLLVKFKKSSDFDRLAKKLNKILPK